VKITLTFEIDEKERVAIAADNIDWDRLDPDPAPKRDVEAWVKHAIRGSLTQLLETFDAGGLDKDKSSDPRVTNVPKGEE